MPNDDRKTKPNLDPAARLQKCDHCASSDTFSFELRKITEQKGAEQQWLKEEGFPGNNLSAKPRPSACPDCIYLVLLDQSNRPEKLFVGTRTFPPQMYGTPSTWEIKSAYAEIFVSGTPLDITAITEFSNWVAPGTVSVYWLAANGSLATSATIAVQIGPTTSQTYTDTLFWSLNEV